MSDQKTPAVAFLFLAAAMIFAVAGCPWAESSEQKPGDRPEIKPERIIEHIEYLSSDEMEGRGSGEPGGEKAALYIAKAFADAGLASAGDGGSFLQGFDVTIGASLGEHNELALLLGDIRQAYRLEEDFLPLSFSESATASGEVVFVGYGISAPAYEYDDYDGLDVEGKVVLVMRHEPAEQDDNSPFDGTSLTHYSELRYKAMNAREHGAAALVLCTDPLNHPDAQESLLDFDARAGRSSLGIPCVQLSTAEASELLRTVGQDLAGIQARIDAELTPRSFPLEGVRMALRVEVLREARRTFNVLGLLEGSDPVLSDELVVLGAHFDHLGRKGEDIYHGADDNASGTAALLELAASLSAAERRPARSILFAAFSGEEIGLLGSTHLVHSLQDVRDASEDVARGSDDAAGVVNSASPPGSASGSEDAAQLLTSRPSAVMVNMDMIGRLREEKLYVGGVASSPLFEPLLTDLAREHRLEVEYSESGYGPSDHSAFYAKGVPVLLFFTGPHTDHHRPTDTWDKINAEGEARVASLVADVLISLASHPDSIAFTRAAEDEGGPPRGEGYGGYGRASLGIIPDFTGGVEGVKLAGVREGSPAERAGLKGNDVMISFDGRAVKGLSDLSYLLKEKKPGDTVVIVVLRDGEEVTFEAVLGERGPR